MSTDTLFPSFELHEVLDGLLKLPPHKLRRHPRNRPQAVHGFSVLGSSHPGLQRTICGLQVMPKIWCDAWMSLLPKVTYPTKPKDLRPLGVTEISGSARSAAVCLCARSQYRCRPCQGPGTLRRGNSSLFADQIRHFGNALAAQYNHATPGRGPPNKFGLVACL